MIVTRSQTQKYIGVEQSNALLQSICFAGKDFMTPQDLKNCFMTSITLSSGMAANIYLHLQLVADAYFEEQEFNRIVYHLCDILTEFQSLPPDVVQRKNKATIIMNYIVNNWTFIITHRKFSSRFLKSIKNKIFEFRSVGCCLEARYNILCL